MASPARVEHPVIGPGHTFATVTDKIASLVLTTKTPLGWFVGFGIAFLLLQLLLGTVALLIFKGVGIWGLGTAAGSAIIEGDLAKVTPEQWARAAIVGTLSALGGGIAVGQRNEPKL